MGWSVEDALTTSAAKCERHDNYEFEGEIHSLAEWATIKGIKYDTLHWRVCRDGWSIEQALNTPVRSKQQNNNTK